MTTSEYRWRHAKTCGFQFCLEGIQITIVMIQKKSALTCHVLINDRKYNVCDFSCAGCCQICFSFGKRVKTELRVSCWDCYPLAKFSVFSWKELILPLLRKQTFCSKFYYNLLTSFDSQNYLKFTFLENQGSKNALIAS